MANYPFSLKMPNSIMTAAERLSKSSGISLNQFIVGAVTAKIGALEEAGDFLKQRAGTAKPGDLLHFLHSAPRRNRQPK